MASRSAGIVLVRVVDDQPQVLLVHPGGPLWARKDLGAWSIPKGEHGPADDPLAAAEREFGEELGVACPAGERRPLGSIRQASGKQVSAWAVIGSIDVDAVVSNTVEIAWPPRSGRTMLIPEIDRASFFSPDDARAKVNPAQRPLIDRALVACGLDVCADPAAGTAQP